MGISSITKFAGKHSTAIGAGITVASNGYDVVTGKKTVGQAAGSITKTAVSTVGGRLATAGAAFVVGGTFIPAVAGIAACFAIDALIDSFTED